VAALLQQFLGGRTSGLFFPNWNSKPLDPSNIRNRVIPLLEAMGLPNGGNHIFRRFRMTWLRENSVPAGIERFWLGHANRTVGDDYSMLKKNLKFRKQLRTGSVSDSNFPTRFLSSVIPNVPKMAV